MKTTNVQVEECDIKMNICKPIYIYEYEGAEYAKQTRISEGINISEEGSTMKL